MHVFFDRGATFDFNFPPIEREAKLILSQVLSSFRNVQELECSRSGLFLPPVVTYPPGNLYMRWSKNYI